MTEEQKNAMILAGRRFGRTRVLLQDVWSVFAHHYRVERGGVITNEWVTESVFYQGDLSGVDTATDWRFREVKDRRSRLRFLGTVTDLIFPVQYPLRLDNGYLLKKNLMY